MPRASCCHGWLCLELEGKRTVYREVRGSQVDIGSESHSPPSGTLSPSLGHEGTQSADEGRCWWHPYSLWK